MVEHIVLFKFNESTTEAQKKEAMERAHQLPKEINGILDLQIGTDFSGRNQGFEVGLTVRFESKEALDVYGPHPKHQEYVQFLKDIGLADVLAFDFHI